MQKNPVTTELSQFPGASAEQPGRTPLTNLDAALDTLDDWLTNRLPRSDYQWLSESINSLLTNFTDRKLYITLGKIPRVIARDDLNPTPEEIAQAHALRPGWHPVRWTIAGTCRILLIAKLGSTEHNRLDSLYKPLCQSADYNELIDLYSALPLIAPGHTIKKQAADGLRTNTRAVFESIAQHNPFPAENFDEQRWNHMILKALFIDSSLGPIISLDSRRNATLSRMLHDYALERRAAGRSVSCELWRCVGPFATDEILNDLEVLLESENIDEQRAAALAIAESPDPQAGGLLEKIPELANAIACGRLRWEFDASLPVFGQRSTETG